MKEFWKDIASYQGIYQVSNLGRIKSLERVVSIFNGGTRLEPELIRTGSSISSGYLNVSLTKDKIRKHYYVHRLVADAFIGDLTQKDVVHIDGDRSNNYVNNLIIIRRGGKVCRPVLQYDLNNNLIGRYNSVKLAAEAVQTCSSSISSACKGISKTCRGFRWTYEKGV